MITEITKNNCKEYDFSDGNIHEYNGVTILAIDGNCIYIVARQYDGHANKARIYTHRLFGQMSRYAEIDSDNMVEMLDKLLTHKLSIYACDTKKDVINLLANKIME